MTELFLDTLTDGWCSIFLTLGICLAFIYFLFYILEAIKDEIEEFNYEEYIKNKEKQSETRRRRKDSK